MGQKFSSALRRSEPQRPSQLTPVSQDIPRNVPQRSSRVQLNPSASQNLKDLLERPSIRNPWVTPEIVKMMNEIVVTKTIKKHLPTSPLSVDELENTQDQYMERHRANFDLGKAMREGSRPLPSDRNNVRIGRKIITEATQPGFLNESQIKEIFIKNRDSTSSVDEIGREFSLDTDVVGKLFLYLNMPHVHFNKDTNMHQGTLKPKVSFKEVV